MLTSGSSAWCADSLHGPSSRFPCRGMGPPGCILPQPQRCAGTLIQAAPWLTSWGRCPSTSEQPQSLFPRFYTVLIRGAYQCWAGTQRVSTMSQKPWEQDSKVATHWTLEGAIPPPGPDALQVPKTFGVGNCYFKTNNGPVFTAGRTATVSPLRGHPDRSLNCRSTRATSSDWRRVDGQPPCIRDRERPGACQPQCTRHRCMSANKNARLMIQRGFLSSQQSSRDSSRAEWPRRFPIVWDPHSTRANGLRCRRKRAGLDPDEDRRLTVTHERASRDPLVRAAPAFAY